MLAASELPFDAGVAGVARNGVACNGVAWLDVSTVGVAAVTACFNLWESDGFLAMGGGLGRGTTQRTSEYAYTVLRTNYSLKATQTK